MDCCCTAEYYLSVCYIVLFALEMFVNMAYCLWRILCVFTCSHASLFLCAYMIFYQMKIQLFTYGYKKRGSAESQSLLTLKSATIIQYTIKGRFMSR